MYNFHLMRQVKATSIKQKHTNFKHKIRITTKTILRNRPDSVGISSSDTCFLLEFTINPKGDEAMLISCVPMHEQRTAEVTVLNRVLDFDTSLQRVLFHKMTPTQISFFYKRIAFF